MNFAFPTLMAGVFAASTALFWGTYGPLLHKGQHDMGSGRLRPFICVGVAYLLVAIVGPIVVMYLAGMELESSKGRGLHHGWTASGILWSTLAGGVGALGAFTLIMALSWGGKSGPLYVMPIVFGLAPMVSTFVSMSVNRNLQISPFFAAGLLLLAVGAVTVLITAPKPGSTSAKDGHAKKPAVAAPKEVASSVKDKSEPAKSDEAAKPDKS
jgi:hypothetical protein